MIPCRNVSFVVRHLSKRSLFINVCCVANGGNMVTTAVRFHNPRLVIKVSHRVGERRSRNKRKQNAICAMRGVLYWRKTRCKGIKHTRNAAHATHVRRGRERFSSFAIYSMFVCKMWLTSYRCMQHMQYFMFDGVGCLQKTQIPISCRCRHPFSAGLNESEKNDATGMTLNDLMTVKTIARSVANRHKRNSRLFRDRSQYEM